MRRLLLIKPQLLETPRDKPPRLDRPASIVDAGRCIEVFLERNHVAFGDCLILLDD